MRKSADPLPWKLGNYELKQVLVTQKVLSHYSKDESYSKSFRLESLGGITVYRTEDPDIFTSASGAILKRKNRQSYPLKSQKLAVQPHEKELFKYL